MFLVRFVAGFCRGLMFGFIVQHFLRSADHNNVVAICWTVFNILWVVLIQLQCAEVYDESNGNLTQNQQGWQIEM